MGMKNYSTQASAEADGFLRMVEIGRRLGVDRRQVYAWWSRRHRNGFPDYGARLQGFPLWHYPTVVEWRKNYEPDRGGAPKAAGQSPIG